MKKIIIYILLICTLQQSCAQNLSEKEMEKIIQTEYNNIPKHKEQPMFALQIDKMGCKISVFVNDEGIGNYWEKGGFSTTETLNANIISSGKQSLVLKVYPRDGMQYIDDLAHVTLQILYVKQKGDPIDTYKVLQNIELPKDLKDKKLPYYEMQIVFDAQVPWDHSAFYDNLQDLRKVPNIEKKLLAKYEDVKSMIINNKQQEYVDFMLKNKKNEFESFYVTKEEINEYVKWYKEDTSPLLNKEILFDPNYEIVYRKGGKIAFLLSKTTKKGVMKMEYGDINTEGDFKGMKNSFKNIAPALVLPKGKNELENL